VWIQLAHWLQFTSKDRLCNTSGFEYLLTRVPTVLLFMIGNNHRIHISITGSPQKHVIKYFHFSKPCHVKELQMGKLSVAVSLVPREKMDFSYHTASCTSKYTDFQMPNFTPSKTSDHSTKLNDGTADYQFLLTTNHTGFIWVAIQTPQTPTAYSVTPEYLSPFITWPVCSKCRHTFWHDIQSSNILQPSFDPLYVVAVTQFQEDSAWTCTTQNWTQAVKISGMW